MGEVHPAQEPPLDYPAVMFGGSCQERYDQGPPELDVMNDGKRLIDCDPHTLDLVQLSLLEKSLMAKLTLVSRELIERLTKMMELAKDAPDMTDDRKLWASGVAYRIKLILMLEEELSRVLNQSGSGQAEK